MLEFATARHEATWSDRADTARSALDGGRFLREVFDGRWMFEERTWRDCSRVYWFTSSNGRPLKPSALRALCLVARGATNDQAAHVLGLGPAAMSEQLSLLCRRIQARPLDLVAFGPLLEIGGAGIHQTLERVGDTRIQLTYRPPRPLLGSLTASELEIAFMVADSMSNAEIALQRRASVRTVCNQLAGLYRKLGVHCRRELVLRLYGGALVPLEPHALAALDRIRS